MLQYNNVVRINLTHDKEIMKFFVPKCTGIQDFAWKNHFWCILGWKFSLLLCYVSDLCEQHYIGLLQHNTTTLLTGCRAMHNLNYATNHKEPSNLHDEVTYSIFKISIAWAAWQKTTKWKHCSSDQWSVEGVLNLNSLPNAIVILA